MVSRGLASVGKTPVIATSSKTSNSEIELADTPFTVTVIKPSFAPTGTITLAELSVASVTAADTPPKSKLFSAGVGEKFPPSIKTDSFGLAALGCTETIAGVGLKSSFSQEKATKISSSPKLLNRIFFISKI